MSDSLLNIRGVTSAAINAGFNNNDLNLSVVSLTIGTTTSAVFTKNIFCAAPVTVAKKHLTKSPLALIINSGNANAGTGSQGIENTVKTCEMLAKEIDIKVEQVLPFSTGVIGQQLDLSKFEIGVPEAVSQLSEDGFGRISRAILTTDLVEKTISRSFKVGKNTVTISGIAKGSGMIRPNMATMLSFIFTDIEATQEELQSCLTVATNQSYNRITVDGDTSTNDACTLSATAKSGINISDCLDKFQDSLNEVTKILAHKVVKDGEGASKFVEIRVTGGQTSEDCLEVAYSVAHSPLVKTALFASDPNWGRILAAVGRANVSQLQIEDINIYLNDLPLITAGQPNEKYTEDDGGSEMSKSDITITIEIGNSDNNESVWTTDLSYEYIKINSEYRS
ncbi:MAG TPA: bifunctional glutamate N-acetyltransferase/amino-acid acetyltransferase ArgJ [Candidatus Thioglobus sp.]|nr:bifunctional glutamate N-acetyltransferase/amino-acid acetyltransferase ArgJ [Candidatus Thioglobus sp.]HIL42159.1 bifunctional glutamate N-acetyltransferase/amino-acid acetyltransferase ArgJ [Gammaproteobacteria bacterium]